MGVGAQQAAWHCWPGSLRCWPVECWMCCSGGWWGGCAQQAEGQQAISSVGSALSADKQAYTC